MRFPVIKKPHILHINDEKGENGASNEKDSKARTIWWFAIHKCTPVATFMNCDLHSRSRILIQVFINLPYRVETGASAANLASCAWCVYGNSGDATTRSKDASANARAPECLRGTPVFTSEDGRANSREVGRRFVAGKEGARRGRGHLGTGGRWRTWRLFLLVRLGASAVDSDCTPPGSESLDFDRSTILLLFSACFTSWLVWWLVVQL